MQTDTDLLQQLNRLIPNETFNAKPRPDIQKDYNDFMQTYNLRWKTDSTATTKMMSARTSVTSLKMLSKNMNGKIRERLKPDAELMIDIIMYEPYIIAMQEHQYELLNAAVFRRIAQITSCKLVMQAKARRNQDGTGIPSRGLAIWVHESILSCHNTQKMKNSQ